MRRRALRLRDERETPERGGAEAIRIRDRLVSDADYDRTGGRVRTWPPGDHSPSLFCPNPRPDSRRARHPRWCSADGDNHVLGRGNDKYPSRPAPQPDIGERVARAVSSLGRYSLSMTTMFPCTRKSPSISLVAKEEHRFSRGSR